MAFRRITGIVGIAAAFTAMLVGGTSNYLLVHSLVEALSAVVAVAVFLLAWNARRLLQQEPFLLRIGIILLFVGVIDVLHALSYRGMGVFASLTPGGDTVNLATQLWIVGRFLFAAALALALLLPRRAVRPSVFHGGRRTVGPAAPSARRSSSPPRQR